MVKMVNHNKHLRSVCPGAAPDSSRSEPLSSEEAWLVLIAREKGWTMVPAGRCYISFRGSMDEVQARHLAGQAPCTAPRRPLEWAWACIGGPGRALSQRKT